MSALEDERSQVETFLEDAHVSALLPITLRYSRESCNVWFGRLFASVGDATAEVMVYPLGRRPELIVEYEDEKASLHELAGQPWSLRPELVLEGRTPDFGILVTCTPEDAQVFRRYLNAQGQGEKSGLTAIRCSITYHPQLDRLLGDDYFREINGTWLKACLMSVKRAEYLVDLIDTLQEAYTLEPHFPGKLSSPFPLPVAVLELHEFTIEVGGESQTVSIDELFKIGSLAATPPEYQRLAQMHSILPSVKMVQDQELSDPETLYSFTRQLFRSIQCGHKLSATFSRDIGCCIRPEFLTVEGAITDLYFFNRPSSPQALHQGQRTDLGNGFTVLHEVTRSATDLLPKIFSEAIESYLGDKDVRADIVGLGVQTGEGLAKKQPMSLNVTPSITVLVDSMLGIVS